MRHLQFLALLLVVGLAAPLPAEARHLSMATPWSKSVCRDLEGTVADAADGNWACCFAVIHQCWSCPVGVPTETNPCTCRGPSCPPEAKIERLYREANRHESIK